ncbi:MAG: hypothetical protein LBD99_04560 [Candidatus Margulisbacteria bacterium]|jgi:hypothetical protein|nr:hypothetical protein [Candidatus Margulisiibacteriota bacterium]
MSINNLNFLFQQYAGKGLFNLKNQQLNRNEFGKLKAATPELSRYKFADFDANKDGQISAAEFHQTLAAYKAQLGIEQKDLQKFHFINIYLPKQISDKASFLRFLQEASCYDVPGADTCEAGLAVLANTDKKLLAEIFQDKKLAFDFLLKTIKNNEIRQTGQLLLSNMRANDAQEVVMAASLFIESQSIWRNDALQPPEQRKFDVDYLFHTYQPALSGTDYLFFQNLYPDKDFSVYYRGSPPREQLDRLLADCRALDPPIEYVERFSSYAELRQIVDMRNRPLDPAQKTALIIFNKDDPNGAFKYNDIGALLANSYQVCYYETARDQELESFFDRTYYCQDDTGKSQRLIDLVYLGGHGMPYGLSLSLGNLTANFEEQAALPDIMNRLTDYLSVAPFSRQELGEIWLNTAAESLLQRFNEFVKLLDSKTLDVTDNAELKKCISRCAENCSFVILACYGGYGRERAVSLANTIAINSTSQKVYATTIAAKSRECRMLFDENHNFAGMLYSSNPADTYIIEKSKLPEPVTAPENSISKAAAAYFRLYMQDAAALEKFGLKIDTAVTADNPQGLIHIQFGADTEAIHYKDTEYEMLETRSFFNLGGPLIERVEIRENPDGSLLFVEISKILGFHSQETTIQFRETGR